MKDKNIFNDAKEALINKLKDIKYEGDLSDIGNEIGICIYDFFSETNKKEDFINGINHGFSLKDGTH